jgi:hypothetical protein
MAKIVIIFNVRRYTQHHLLRQYFFVSLSNRFIGARRPGRASGSPTAIFFRLGLCQNPLDYFFETRITPLFLNYLRHSAPRVHLRLIIIPDVPLTIFTLPNTSSVYMVIDNSHLDFIPLSFQRSFWRLTTLYVWIFGVNECLDDVWDEVVKT